MRVPLELDAPQRARLEQLQATFAQACNTLSPQVADRRCWNRVTLHHLSYRDLRERFPQLGSQMACNAIYAVSRAARLVYQHPKSPFNIDRLGAQTLPRLRFNQDSPVYYDRHTFSLRNGEVSLFTLEGRMRCAAKLTPDTAATLGTARLREVLLARTGERYSLLVSRVDPEHADAAPGQQDEASCSGPVWPSHLQVVRHEDLEERAASNAPVAAAASIHTDRTQPLSRL
jgi:hypothetical protein